MRIIAGRAKGRRLISVPEKYPVKPISDRMKQSLFDILRPRITASIFLDLFAGTGAVGLEALSRGAMKVVFVDKEPVCLKAITRNLEKLGFADNAKVLKADILSSLKWLAHYSGGEGYDIIFMGPPYRTPANRPLSFTGPVLQSVAEGGILAAGGIIVAQHHDKEQFAVPAELEIFRTSSYGDTTIDFLRLKTLSLNDI